MTKAAFIDLLERSVWTFVQVFLTSFVVTDLATAETAALAGAAAVLSIVKSFAATRLGNPDSASTVDGAIAQAKG